MTNFDQGPLGLLDRASETPLRYRFAIGGLMGVAVLAGCAPPQQAVAPSPVTETVTLPPAPAPAPAPVVKVAPRAVAPRAPAAPSDAGILKFGKFYRGQNVRKIENALSSMGCKIVVNNQLNSYDWKHGVSQFENNVGLGAGDIGSKTKNAAFRLAAAGNKACGITVSSSNRNHAKRAGASKSGPLKACNSVQPLSLQKGCVWPNSNPIYMTPNGDGKNLPVCSPYKVVVQGPCRQPADPPKSVSSNPLFNK